LDALPVQRARDCFLAWRRARREEAAPHLSDFAPHRLPPQTMPWVLIHRERADDKEIVYGLTGEELVFLFGENPKGKPILAYADPVERAQRLAVIRTAMHTCRPVWFTGSLLFENKDACPVGRLGLPARSGRDLVLMLIYFMLGGVPAGRLRGQARPVFDARDVLWCGEAEARGF
jgi:hypothetical protein